MALYIFYWSAGATLAAITPNGNILPAYPGTAPDPWNAGTELRVGFTGHGLLTLTSGSDVLSAGGSIGFDPGVVGTMNLIGSGTTWTNSQNLSVGVFGKGDLNVFQGAYLQNVQASLGHINGTATVRVEGAGSSWLTAGDLVVGNGAQASLTIRDAGTVVSGASWVGLNTSASGSVSIDGAGSAWTVLQSLSLGDSVDGGDATLALTGSGSRLYVGAAALQHGSQLPNGETASIVSATSGLAQLNIYAENTFTNAGNAYLGRGLGESGSVLVSGSGSAWHNMGSVQIGSAGSALVTLQAGGIVSAGAGLSIGTLGTLAGDGTILASVVSAGTVSPGQSVGTLFVNQNYTQTSSGTLQVELYGTGSADVDLLQVTGAASVNGRLQVLLGTVGGNPFVPQIGNEFTFLTAAQGQSGSFSMSELPHLPSGRMWQLRTTTTSSTLAVTRAGDYNDDGVVDAADYVVWRRLIGTTFDPRADGDTNGVINSADYAVWRANFGALASASLADSGPDSLATVPEPATPGVLLMALLIISGRRECRARSAP